MRVKKAETLEQPEDTDHAQPTSRKVKRRGVEQDHQSKDEEHSGHLTKGDEEKTDVFGDTHFPSDLFGLLAKILPLVEHITFMELKKDQGTDDDPSIQCLPGQGSPS